MEPEPIIPMRVPDDPDHPPVEWAPEPYASIAARVGTVFDHCFDPERIAVGGIRPAELRENVFDFEDGLRLILSREGNDRGVLLHASASIRRGSRLDGVLAGKAKSITKLRPTSYRALREVKKMAKDMIKDIEKRIRRLTGKPFFLAASTLGGVIHFACYIEKDDPLYVPLSDPNSDVRVDQGVRAEAMDPRWLQPEDIRWLP